MKDDYKLLENNEEENDELDNEQSELDNKP